jgi:hypothetical protein
MLVDFTYRLDRISFLWALVRSIPFHTGKSEGKSAGIVRALLYSIK